jgi:hypothetical protein
LQITSQSEHSLHGYSDAHDWVRDNDDHCGVDIAYYLFHEKKKPHLMELQVALNNGSKKCKIKVQVIIQHRSINSMASVTTIHSLFSIA